MTNVTIGMVTYNRLELTKQTFEKSLKETGKKYNLIIFDNGSVDGTVNWITKKLSNKEKEFPYLDRFAIVASGKNQGVAYGRNMCLKKTKEYFPKTKYICTLDNDVEIPNKKWLKDCCDILEANDKFGCCAVNYEKKKFPETKIKLLNGEIKKAKIIINTPGTATAVFHYNIFEKIGYFKRYNNGIYGHEDANYFYRIKKLGKTLLYLEDDGIHLGEGNNDVGEYREMKTKEFNKYRPEFVKDLKNYNMGANLFVNFEEIIPQYYLAEVDENGIELYRCKENF